MPDKSTSGDLTSIIAALAKVERGDAFELDPFLHEVKSHIPVPGGNNTCHLRVIALDGNGLCRIDDLMHFLQETLIDYAIPRSEISDALAHNRATGSTFRIGRLAQKARQLFADVAKSGEGGELLLYLLAERFLKLPQLLCKMDLKTSTNMHVHGSDGLHVGPGTDGKVALYWGESKIYAKFSGALDQCMKSLAPLLTDDKALESRDLQLLGRYMDLADPYLEDALKQLLDPYKAGFSSVEYRGVCLVGFDSIHYPGQPNQISLVELASKATEELEAWISHIAKKCVENSIETYHIHIFCLPIPSAAEFRKKFRASFGVGDK